MFRRPHDAEAVSPCVRLDTLAILVSFLMSVVATFGPTMPQLTLVLQIFATWYIPTSSRQTSGALAGLSLSVTLE